MSSKNPVDTFDIIIVGGGTAGSVLAARLSSNPSLRILVLEAGQNRNEDPNVRVPGFSKYLLGNPSYDWQFQTSPEEGLNGRVIQQPRGKLWGGSSAINSHALVYPSRGYHNAWSSLLGRGAAKSAERWDWEGIKRYYRKFQTLQEPSEDVKRELSIEVSEWGVGDDAGKPQSQKNENGHEGVRASFPVTPHVLQKAWVDAIHDLGFSTSKNPLDGDLVGGSTTTNAIDSSKRERSHAGVAFLEPSTKRENLVVRSNVFVEKVMFDENEKNGNLVASGVLYRPETSQQDVTVYARQEVIICAGTYGSPKILELSGIGDREIMAAVGINCLRNLPGVGENLQDHLNFGPSVEVHDIIMTADVTARDATAAEAAKTLYEAEKKGSAAEGAAYSFSYIPLQTLSSSDEVRELDALVTKTLEENSSAISKGYNAQYEIIQRLIQDPNESTGTVFMTRKQRSFPSSGPVPGNYMTIIAMLSYPFSRGSSHITSTKSSTPPEIKFNYLQHPLDAEIFSRHVVQIGQMLTQPSLSAQLKPGGNTLPTGYSRQRIDIDDIKRYLPQYAATNYHPAGTCAMMGEELGGVVDEALKVYGTANVRVCDASVIPIVPRGNILSTVYAVAEKGADIILRAEL
ncbi:alcohol oxidase [Mollisia scopiformis]|uniref:Alcohol oxidase n=1 Tax=Mollisia scopiformis TaxID=149040 RepID=A0A194X4V9_MOLSC|nr:alcohol oxidase [Mollisia scopiformis]KUJ15213.1 alcohol oxidase [Mollisia scopiformis]